ncbi:MAG: HAD family phosphatase [Bacteroidales bacterium]|nr:HAD family phosphatase [Bacteroidales bacterium]
MIKAIVFDMGGVIVRLNMDRCISNFKELAGFEDIEDYLDRFHQKGFISDLEEGKTQPEDFYRECLEHSRPGTTVETACYCFCSLLDGLEGDTLDLIRSLRCRYDLYVLSNNNPVSRGYFREMMKEQGLDPQEVFTKEFYSYELKMLKPSREIYERVIEGVGTRPEEILFIDDARDNIEAAKATGITTLWLRPGMDIAQEVERILEER